MGACRRAFRGQLMLSGPLANVRVWQYGQTGAKTASAFP
ncbi:hypothetical protein PCAR4_470040 [Paraburkholderia caribensis]|nr:hypothetical protein PCAR4_470040 [Paraburkholderia caribensis]